jgi:hypothetical protein
MKIKGMIIGAVVLLFALDAFYFVHRKAAGREDAYQSVLDEYERSFHLGMTRAEVHAYLQAQRTWYSERSIPDSGNAQSILIKIGLESTRSFKPGNHMSTVYIALDFIRANKAGPSLPGQDLPQDSDVLSVRRIFRGE